MQFFSKIFLNGARYNPGDVIFDSNIPGTYNRQIRVPGVYNVRVIGSGGGSAAVASTQKTAAMGGGGGAALVCEVYIPVPGNFSIVIGNVGIGEAKTGTNAFVNGTSGGNSSITGPQEQSIVAYGGGGGNARESAPSVSEGYGGGKPDISIITIVSGTLNYAGYNGSGNASSIGANVTGTGGAARYLGYGRGGSSSARNIPTTTANNGLSGAVYIQYLRDIP
jgi:hypothetical protein